MGEQHTTSGGVDPARRVELLIQKLDALPSPGPVIDRIAALIIEDDAHPAELLEIIRCDPGLTCTLLALCRFDAVTAAARPTTADDAVRALGQEIVEAAALSAPIVELWNAGANPGAEPRPQHPVFNGALLWQHSLAVARLCRRLAEVLPRHEVDPHEAFTAGLLHDLGLSALHLLVPASLDRACATVDGSGTLLDKACEKLLGVTPAKAGRRIAEHWRLPHMIGDAIWLHGQPAASLPDLRHRPLIELVTLADAAARARYVTPAGHSARGEDLAELARPLGLAAEQVEQALDGLTSAVTDVAEQIGIGRTLEPADLAVRLASANAVLGRRVATSCRFRARADSGATALRAITEFHDTETMGGSFASMLGKVVASAHEVFGGRYFAILWQPRRGEPWQFLRFAGDGRLLRSAIIQSTPPSDAITDLADELQLSIDSMAMLPWLSPHIDDARNRLKLLPLRCGWGVQAILIHDASLDGVRDRLRVEALSRTWAGALVTASHHAGAKALGERLARSNSKLLETRDVLTRREKLASLGEIAAGAAHEMNNPLTVISGRAQILSAQIEDPQHREMAQQIFEQSHRLSDMISTLRSFAEPLNPHPVPTDLRAMIEAEVATISGAGDVVIDVDDALATVVTDPELTARALHELLQNASESEGSGDIEVRVQIDPLDGRLQVQIVDDGIGLTRHTLAHAFDPFFSAKSAGRQPGLGLATARRLIEAQGGQITLENGTDRGAVATIWLPGWRTGHSETRQVA